jgi:hypothetical protein
MARKFKQLQDKMDPASRDDNRQCVREELRRMTLDELRSAKRLTQRIWQRFWMYLRAPSQESSSGRICT